MASGMGSRKASPRPAHGKAHAGTCRLKSFTSSEDNQHDEKLAGYEFKCKDIGMKCGFEVKGASSRDEVMQVASVHAKATHNMQTIPPDVAQKVSSAIRG